MDTIYVIKDEYFMLFTDYAIANKYYYKSQQSCHYFLYDMFNGKRLDTPEILSITLNNFDETWTLPYVDSLRYLIRYKNTYRIQNIVNKHDKGNWVKMRTHDPDNKFNFRDKKSVIDSEVDVLYKAEYLDKIMVKPKAPVKAYKEPKLKVPKDMVYIKKFDEVLPLESTIVATNGEYARRRIPKHMAYAYDNDGTLMIYVSGDKSLVIPNGVDISVPRMFTRKDKRGRYLLKKDSVKFVNPETGDKDWYIKSELVMPCNYDKPVPSEFTYLYINEQGETVNVYKHAPIPESLREPTMEELWAELEAFDPRAAIQTQTA